MRWSKLFSVALASAVLSLAGCDSPSETSGDTTAAAPLQDRKVVLVHGAWMGGWAWADVAAGLEAKGAKVTTVALPAHGTDKTEASAATLDGYVKAVQTAVDAAGEPVILVGHSMAGAVLTEVAEQKPGSVAELVYVAAYVPADGQSIQDLAGTDADSHVGPVIQIDMAALTAKIPEASLADVFCADCDDSHLEALKTNYRDEPVIPLGTPVHATEASWGKVPKYYVFTEQDHAVSPALQQKMTAGITWAGTKTLATSHSPLLSAPSALVDAIVGLVGG